MTGSTETAKTLELPCPREDCGYGRVQLKKDEDYRIDNAGRLVSTYHGWCRKCGGLLELRYEPPKGAVL